MSAMDPATRTQHIALTRELFMEVQSIEELADGYAFRLPNEVALLTKAGTFISFEKQCCPFFGFAIVVEPEGGPLWLHVTGRQGVKGFIQAELGGALRKEVAEAASDAEAQRRASFPGMRTPEHTDSK